MSKRGNAFLSSVLGVLCFAGNQCSAKMNNGANADFVDASEIRSIVREEVIRQSANKKKSSLPARVVGGVVKAPFKAAGFVVGTVGSAASDLALGAAKTAVKVGVSVAAVPLALAGTVKAVRCFGDKKLNKLADDLMDILGSDNVKSYLESIKDGMEAPVHFVGKFVKVASKNVDLNYIKAKGSAAVGKARELLGKFATLSKEKVSYIRDYLNSKLSSKKDKVDNGQPVDFGRGKHSYRVVTDPNNPGVGFVVGRKF